MQITDIKFRKLFNDDSKPLKAVLSVTFDDCLALHDVKIVFADNRFFVVMPSRKNADGSFKDIVHPINSDFRKSVESAIIDAFNKECYNSNVGTGVRDTGVRDTGYGGTVAFLKESSAKNF